MPKVGVSPDRRDSKWSLSQSGRQGQRLTRHGCQMTAIQSATERESLVREADNAKDGDGPDHRGRKIGVRDGVVNKVKV